MRTQIPAFTPLVLIVIITTTPVSALHLSSHLERHSTIFPSTAYSQLFQYIENDDEIENKMLKYHSRNEKEQERLNNWMVKNPTFARYVAEQISKNSQYAWVNNLSDNALRQFLSVMLLEYRNQDVTDPNVMGQITQELYTNPEIYEILRQKYTAVQPVYE